MDSEDNLYLVKQKELELIDTNVTDSTLTIAQVMAGVPSGTTPDLSGVKLQMNDAIYQITDAATNWDKDKYIPVGGIVYKYNTTSGFLDFFRKIKNDGWDSAIAAKKRVIKTDHRFDNICSDETAKDCFWEYDGKFVFDTPKVANEDLLFCTAATYIRNSGSNIPFPAIWLEANSAFDKWNTKKIPNATIRNGAFILNVEGELYIYEKKDNVDFQNGRSDADFFGSRPVSDSEYYELLDDKDCFNLVSDLNQNNPFDQYTNSFAKFTNGYFKFKIKDCEFDFLAVRNFRSNTFNIEVLDENNNVLSTNSFSVDFNKPETFIHLDPANRELLTNNCTLSKYRGDFQFVFNQLHPSTHSVKLTFDGETELGALFLGKREKLPCVSREIQVKYKDFKTASVNEITQTKSINVSEDRLKTTTMTLNFTTHEEALVWLTYLARESYHISYFDSSQATGLSLLSHGGFIETPEIKNKMRAVFFKLNEYNNA